MNTLLALVCLLATSVTVSDSDPDAPIVYTTSNKDNSAATTMMSYKFSSNNTHILIKRGAGDVVLSKNGALINLAPITIIAEEGSISLPDNLSYRLGPDTFTLSTTPNTFQHIGSYYTRSDNCLKPVSLTEIYTMHFALHPGERLDLTNVKDSYRTNMLYSVVTNTATRTCNLTAYYNAATNGALITLSLRDTVRPRATGIDPNSHTLTTTAIPGLSYAVIGAPTVDFTTVRTNAYIQADADALDLDLELPPVGENSRFYKVLVTDCP